jgi:hypothetical protein
MRVPTDNRQVMLRRVDVAAEAGLLDAAEARRLSDDVLAGLPLAPITARLDEVVTCAIR